MAILPNIQGHNDLIQLNDAQRQQLCGEIREFIISHVAKTGGHLASNLGVVELTVAIETVYNTAQDRLVFDVGHQSYVHKLLTGRQADFEHLRMFGGMSGFPKPSESGSDSFVAGHASSSVSIALGMARARKLTGQNYSVVALIGDGAATGGMAYEGLNDVGCSGEPMVIILNDNEMSIDPNVGGMAMHLSKVRTKEGYSNLKKFYRYATAHIPGGDTIYKFTHRVKERLKHKLLRGTMFEHMGLDYLGPVDGHDLPELLQVLRTAKEMNKPVLVHVMTHKGHGFEPAENDPAKFHGVGKFDPVDGHGLGAKKQTFSDTFGQTALELAREDPRVCAITAAMPGGTGLLDFKEEFPDRLYDVGIAEEHAVSMAGGLAKQGAIPIVAIYSTFFQRAYDQIIQDIALLGLHVVLCVDRAGLVGEDGSTHHGVFDVGFMGHIPGMTLLSPVSHQELEDMLRWAVKDCAGPVAIRYPRGAQGSYQDSGFHGDPNGLCAHQTGKDATIITYGTMINPVLAAAQNLCQRGIHVTVLRLLSTTHIPYEQIISQITGSHVVVVEEVCRGNGIREAFAWNMRELAPQLRVWGMDLGTEFVPHGDAASLYHLTGLDADSIANYVQEVLSREE